MENFCFYRATEVWLAGYTNPVIFVEEADVRDTEGQEGTWRRVTAYNTPSGFTEEILKMIPDPAY